MILVRKRKKDFRRLDTLNTNSIVPQLICGFQQLAESIGFNASCFDPHDLNNIEKGSKGQSSHNDLNPAN